MKVGDKVVIADPLPYDNESPGVHMDMHQYQGREATITQVSTNTFYTYYSLDIDNGLWTWIDGFFQSQLNGSYEVGDEVIISPDLNETSSVPPGVNSEMVTLRGKRAIITEVLTYQIPNFYYIDIDPSKWAWAEWMFTRTPPMSPEEFFKGVFVDEK